MKTKKKKKVKENVKRKCLLVYYKLITNTVSYCHILQFYGLRSLKGVFSMRDFHLRTQGKYKKNKIIAMHILIYIILYRGQRISFSPLYVMYLMFNKHNTKKNY